ncbi:histidine phosphatase family protein [Nocardioides sp. SYSU D00038]|uniref:histidine phosphatase family protein n=1 Tax=Nocardioides sp. SYSU D00038 TaxID=2812554 RepID=UPI0019672750|nr:histidine phosphatase family protein [Nocardioides sp. SYSU D00038]
MSSLQCPARLYVARHGETEYETQLVSDDGGSLTARGREQARELGERLRGERIARVWCSPLSRAVQTAEIAAGVLGVDVVVREGLREYAVGDLAGSDADEASTIGPVLRAWAEGDDEATIPGAGRVADWVARVGGVLEEVADAHPGEAVLVVSHGGAILSTVPQLGGRPRRSAADVTLPHAAYLAVERDADGWRPLADESESGR